MEAWRAYACADPGLKRELCDLESLEERTREKEIAERFYKNLEFGTGGLRGIIGAGTNRMNIYTVARASRGYADYLKETENGDIAVSVAYDSRVKSREFASVAAYELAAAGIHVYLFKELAPTPLLSYIVPHLKCAGGIVITASHNPAQYNGYKVYGKDGGQITGKAAQLILNRIEEHDLFEGTVRCFPEEEIGTGLVSYVPDEWIQRYVEDVCAEAFGGRICRDLAVVYSPLNGTGLRYVSRVLEHQGFTCVHVVEEQKYPDGNFPTCPVPNPEKREALELALRDAERYRADLVLATDPDCDRLGVAVPQKDGFRLLTGNEIGVLLLDYICKRRKELGIMPADPIAFKTIVTTDLAKKVADGYGVEMQEVLTGFKYIGEKIGELTAKGETSRFILGIEESCGYLSGPYVRDKDGVNAASLVCEMAGYYKALGTDLVEMLGHIYEKFGVYLNVQYTLPFPGRDGTEKMARCMENCRERVKDFHRVCGIRMVRIEDYLESAGWLDTGETVILELPRSNVIRLRWEDGSTVSVRPSGTEPKLKLYIQAVGRNLEEAKDKEQKLKNLVEELLGLRSNL